MMKSAVSLAALTLLIVYVLTSSFSIGYVKAWSGDLTIKSDGSVDPPTAPVSHSGNVYSLTDDVQGSITVEQDNIAVNGMGHAVRWTGTSPIGVNLGSRTNVTLVNIRIENFVSGIYLYTSNQNTITQTSIIGNSGYGIYLYSSSNNNVIGNSITANTVGIFLDSSSANSISENRIENNSEGVYTQNSLSNRIFHNNFLNNSEQAYAETSADIWDNTYPSGGNYWDNYTGVDQKCGSNQDHSGSDGMGDTPYTIDSNNEDNYPLMNPWTPPAGHNVAVISVVSAKTVIGQGYSGNVTVYGANKGEYFETFSVTTYADVTPIASTTVPLGSGSTASNTFSWNTNGTPRGNYTISAYAGQVPGETDTSDNNFTDGWILVSVVGDVNGDGKVNLVDVFSVALAYGSVPGMTNWKPNLDINNDGKINLIDYFTTALNYGKS
jgi:parallel beta-helix repeat protein